MQFIKTFAFILLLSNITLIPEPYAANIQNIEFNDNTVIATWQPERVLLTSFDEAEKLLSNSRYLFAQGDERKRVTRFTNAMRNNYDALNPGQKERLVILEARLLQGIHKFEQAEQQLAQISHFRSAAAHLLLADINVQQGDAKQAKRYCEQLVGQTSFLIAFTCIVNADFSQNAEPRLLQKLKAFEVYAGSATHSEQEWFYEVLADMSLQLGNAEEALQLLGKTEFSQLPISALLVWTEAHTSLGNYKTITETLEASVPDISTADDGLLLQWAKAERAQGINASNVQSQLAKNMEIRVWREDSSHAAQVATYFLEIEPNYSLALKFAELNWQYAQNKSDKQLLERARQEKAVATDV
ncbi:hypothetical protein JC525_03125 [Alteromonas sp. IB21]|uniref:hypothetical protein n=1 Tax=Alteromonas sp. IB21 TaxID=2779369 RepID=UPI0018E71BA3|nr:hypothetical protein [Alteromonas sp. IB21]MBJ2127922.1 hypothetical protein [Alteromonas sp. IB21]